MRLRRHPCGGQPTSRYPKIARLRFIFEQANHTSIPTPVPLAHHSRKEPQCSTCTRGYANNAWRKPFGERIPSHGSLPPSPVRRTGHASMPMSNAFVALLLREPTYLRYPFKRRSLIVLGANQQLDVTQLPFVGSLSFQRKPAGHRYPKPPRLRCVFVQITRLAAGWLPPIHRPNDHRRIR